MAESSMATARRPRPLGGDLGHGGLARTTTTLVMVDGMAAVAAAAAECGDVVWSSGGMARMMTAW
uniref:Uncharacterized protein n=1 Tax=Oryza sativa subsp. japonica TaxID=39947 RepID=Q6K1N7_ORYSJ|nr:hypothetical protein [Oryza sativa Japonica Group]